MELGDTLAIEGTEVVVWSYTVERFPTSTTIRILCVDPLQASVWREEARAKRAQNELFLDGKVQKMVEQAIE